MRDLLNVAVAGATGYIGLELVRILSKHPKVKIIYLCAQSSVGQSISTFDSRIKSTNLPKISTIKKIDWGKINTIFTALPNGEAQAVAKIVPKNIKLIDLSGDFRLANFQSYNYWYGVKHKCKDLIKDSVYSITEFSRKKLSNAKIIGCAGCYPTSIQIPLIPILEKKMISTKNIIIDSKSGYSGAGKNIKKKFNHKNIFKSVSSYSVGAHKHMAEIDQELSLAAKKKIKVSFTPHLLPMFRGILSTIYVKTINKNNAKKIYKTLKKYHKQNHFVKIAKFNESIGTGEVMNTNYCNISVCENREKNSVIIISAIDNLIKGGSGQAVQNMNAAYKFNEKLGLV